MQCPFASLKEWDCGQPLPRNSTGNAFLESRRFLRFRRMQKYDFRRFLAKKNRLHFRPFAFYRGGEPVRIFRAVPAT
jgi:hypothetical protein